MAKHSRTAQLRVFVFIHVLAVALGIVAPRDVQADPVSYRLRWQPSAGASSYRVYIGNASKVYGSPIDLGAVTPGSDGIASKVVGPFDPTLTSYVALSAVNAAGESLLSNEVVIAATQCAMSCDDNNGCTTDLCEVGKCVSRPVSGTPTCDDHNAQTQNDMCMAGVCAGSLIPPPPPPPPTPTPTPTPAPQCRADADCGGSPDTCSAAARCVSGQCVAGARLSCAGPEKSGYRLRWNVPPGSVSSYRLYRGTASGSYQAPSDLGAVAADANGVASAVIAGFDTSRDNFVALTAVNAAGESALSNEIKIAATRCATGCSSDVCTEYACQNGVCSLTPAPSSKVCDDGNSATLEDRCNLGQCAGHAPAPAGNPPASQLPGQGAPPAAPGCTANRDCADADLCNGSERCVSGSCVAGTALTCGAVGPCEVATCEAANGCVAQAAANGTSCDDGNPGTEHDMCSAGTCRGTPPCSVEGAPRTVRLSWLSDPAHTMTLLWDAPKQSSVRVRVRPVGGAWRELSVAPAEVVACEGHYAVELAGLQPYSLYQYAIEYVSGGQILTKSFKFSTAPDPAVAPDPNNSPVVYTAAFFASMGLADQAGSPQAKSVIAAIRGYEPELLLGGGGYAYASEVRPANPDPKDAIERWFAQLMSISSRAPFLPVYGETEVSEGVNYYRSRHAAFDRPPAGPSYSFDAGATHYTALFAPSADAIDASKPAGAAQLAWLDGDLAAARQRGARFLVVYMHADAWTTHPAAALPAAVRDALTAIFDRNGVNLVLSGDTPGLERSYPIRGGVALPVAVAQPIDRAQGVVYLRTGSGGREDQLQWTPPAAPAWLAFREARMKTFVLVHEVDGTSLMVETVGVPSDGSEPQTLDLFVLR